MAEFVKTYDLDVPEALELDLMFYHVQQLLSGKSVMLPKYDLSGTTIRIDNHTLAEPSKIIISEGLFALTEKSERLLTSRFTWILIRKLKRADFSQERKNVNSVILQK